MSTLLVSQSRGTISEPGVALTTPALPTTCIRGSEMAKGTCSVDGCDTPHHARGWCQYHYRRWQLSGEPGPLRGERIPIVRRTDPLLRMSERLTIDEDGHWLMPASVNGYGSTSIGRQHVPAHRFTFERFIRRIEPGEQIHHKCGVKNCCNPDHLEAVTALQHKRRHASDTCHRGHCDWSIRPTGHRTCRVCHNERERARHDRARRLKKQGDQS